MHIAKFDKPKHAQTLLSSAGFQSKNKISINNPVQTHISIEGVQAYTPEEIQAMKIR